MTRGSSAADVETVGVREVWSVARRHAPDHYLSALLAPAQARADLVALAAFVGDVDRIVLWVTEAELAEIRLQWWRDTLAARAADPTSRSGSPLADAVGEVMVRRGIPVALYQRHLDARSHDLYADPLLDEAALEAQLAADSGSVFEMACRICGGDGPATAEAETLLAQAAIVYGSARLVARAAVALARGRSPFPGAVPETDPALRAMLAARTGEIRERAAALRDIWRTASRPARAACLPTSLAEPYLRASEQVQHDPRRLIADLGPLERVWWLWRAHAFGRLV